MCKDALKLTRPFVEVDNINITKILSPGFHVWAFVNYIEVYEFVLQLLLIVKMCTQTDYFSFRCSMGYGRPEESISDWFNI
ncbi:hypothetical protein SAMN04487943_101287 [Gracilibacillus orientalis]|uniref:Uncharacterized protein n=1 Tax=Gracilibacillus orientalis TaxID=334253 RepID=A0A1I4HAT9_9BACI|nr:hypothetical protein SAMN04487943_101287 [Gracilibacillus orientalis]